MKMADIDINNYDTLANDVVKTGLNTGEDRTRAQLVSLSRLSVGCVTTQRRQSGEFAGF